jgi:hypothetical protein
MDYDENTKKCILILTTLSKGNTMKVSKYKKMYIEERRMHVFK